MKLTERKLRGIIREELSRLTERASMHTVKQVASAIGEVLGDIMTGGKRDFKIHISESEPQIFVTFQESDYGMDVRVFESGRGVKVELTGEGADMRTVKGDPSEFGLMNHEFAGTVEEAMRDVMRGPDPEGGTYLDAGPRGAGLYP